MISHGHPIIYWRFSYSFTYWIKKVAISSVNIISEILMAFHILWLSLTEQLQSFLMCHVEENYQACLHIICCARLAKKQNHNSSCEMASSKKFLSFLFSVLLFFWSFEYANCFQIDGKINAIQNAGTATRSEMLARTPPK